MPEVSKGKTKGSSSGVSPKTSGSTEAAENQKLFGAKEDELFNQPEITSSPWWKINFLFSEPILLGTWDGVYTSCIIHLFGVIVFLRSGWIVGNSGIVVSIIIALLSLLVSGFSATAAIRISERCYLPGSGGNLHSLLSYVLGARFGGAVSIVYCFGKAVSCALHAVGFAESVAGLLRVDDPWFERIVGTFLILLLFIINVAGVKWVARLQFTLLFILFLAALDFAVGLFITRLPEKGIIGYDAKNLEDNLSPESGKDGLDAFRMFGVFFPATTGVFAGINMSGDLFDPRRSLPRGTFAAIGTSFCLYLLFMVGLGTVCIRPALLNDYLIVTKVAAVGYLVMAGLYISSVSHCLGSIYASTRIIQNMAHEQLLPGNTFLGRGRGPNKVPVSALVLFSIVVSGFIMIRQLNVLAVIVTILFLFTYAMVDYAYFSLSMTIDIQKERYSTLDPQESPSTPTFLVSKPGKQAEYGTLKDQDLDRLFPERTQGIQHVIVRGHHSSTDQSESSLVTSPDEHSSIKSAADSLSSHAGEVESALSVKGLYSNKMSKSKMYQLFTHKYVALFSAALKIVLLMLVHWIYGILAFAAVVFFWFYIGHINSGNHPGITQFSLFHWFKHLLYKCLGKDTTGFQHFVISTSNPPVAVTPTVLTEEGTDFANREKYHQTTTISQPASTEY